MLKFLHDADDDAKAVAILRVFSKNSRATNANFKGRQSLTRKE